MGGIYLLFMAIIAAKAALGAGAGAGVGYQVRHKKHDAVVGALLGIPSAFLLMYGVAWARYLLNKRSAEQAQKCQSELQIDRCSVDPYLLECDIGKACAEKNRGIRQSNPDATSVLLSQLDPECYKVHCPSGSQSAKEDGTWWGKSTCVFPGLNTSPPSIQKCGSTSMPQQPGFTVSQFLRAY